MTRPLVITLDPGRTPHLPALSGRHHHPVALSRLLDCLATDYGAAIARLGSSRVATPKLLENGLGHVAGRLCASPGLLLFLLRCHLTVFDRGGDRFCCLSLRDSVPGRPSSMTRVTTLVATLTRLFPDTRGLLVADVDLLPSRADGGGAPSAKDCAELVVDAVRAAGRTRVSPAVLVRRESGPDGEPVMDVPVVLALDRCLRSAADAGTPMVLPEVVARVADFLDSSGSRPLSSATTVTTSPGLAVTPLHTVERIPEYIRADLYSPDPGSRLDAVAELAERSRKGDPHAKTRLEEVRRHDSSADVRGFARTELTCDDRLTADEMRTFGLLPDAVLRSAVDRQPLPPLSEPFDGSGFLGVDAPVGQWFEQPTHQVRVGAFRMALRPITNRDYLAFVAACPVRCPDHWNTEWVFREDIDHPVVMVSWYDARSYCQWLTQEARSRGLIKADMCVSLPTEAEWEIAARNAGVDNHPWGDGFSPTRCNVRSSGNGMILPVGSRSPDGDSRAGCVDFVGNVWEWTSTAWGPSGRQPSFLYPYDPGDGREDPHHGDDVRRVVRGGAYYYADLCANSYTRNQSPPTKRHRAGGFRVVVRQVRRR